ncbi:hypothetical protein GGI13_000661 [Coemansia sp. RSA 455]|nr:hypothetical protein GGI13_000661 [Coemansia sp. RSA 455]
MTVAIIGLVCAAVFFLAVFGVFYLRKVKGADIPERPSKGSNGSIFAFLRRNDNKRKKPQQAPNQGRPHRQQQQRQQRAASVATFYDQPRNYNRSHNDDEETEAPIPGLFDVPDYDNPNTSSASMPRVPGAAAFGDNGRSPQQSDAMRSTRSAGDMTAINMNNPVIDRRFPENPMPTDMPSILARLQDPNIESSLPPPPPPVDTSYSPFYGPMAPSEAEIAGYCNGTIPIPPPPPPPPGSTALYSVRPQNYDPRYASNQQQYAAMAAHYDPRHMAMADHYYRQQMQAMPRPPMMSPPMQHPPPMPPILGFQHPPAAPATPVQPPQAPAPVASPNPRFGSPEEEEAWKRSNRLTTSSPPAYSAL